jgi:hypothetical protein
MLGLQMRRFLRQNIKKKKNQANWCPETTNSKRERAVRSVVDQINCARDVSRGVRCVSHNTDDSLVP